MNKNFEQMLRLVDYVDGLMVVDKNCIIRHYYTAYPDLVNLRQDEPLNRSLFEIYPTLKREDSYICRALKTGESFINYEQTYINYKGDSMEPSTSTSTAVCPKSIPKAIGASCTRTCSTM